MVENCFNWTFCALIYYKGNLNRLASIFTAVMTGRQSVSVWKEVWGVTIANHPHDDDLNTLFYTISESGPHPAFSWSLQILLHADGRYAPMKAEKWAWQDLLLKSNPIEIVSIIHALHRDRRDCFYQVEIVNYSATASYGLLNDLATITKVYLVNIRSARAWKSFTITI